MSLADWLGDNLIEVHRPSAREIASDYERTGTVTESDAAAMLSIARQLRADVERWIRVNYPELAEDF